MPTSLPVTTMTPKAAETFGESLGGGTAGQALARRRQRTRVHVAGAGGQRGYVCSLLASTQGRTLSSGWGLWEAENGHRLPSEASRPASPCPPQGRLRKPLPRVPLHHLGKQTLGKAVPPHTHPVQHTLGLNRQDPSHIPQHPIIPIQAPVTDKCWWVPGV